MCLSLSFSSIKNRLQRKFHCYEIFKNTYSEEHLCMAASGLTLKSDWLEPCFWTVAF